MWGLQDVSAELNKVTALVDGVSGLSLGTGSGPSQAIACYQAGSAYFYGMALVELPSTLPGLGLWGSSGTTFPRQTGATGTDAHLIISNLGNVGIGVTAPAQRLTVQGNISCSGSITGSSKRWDIPHPDPAKPGMRLRHFCTESDDIGGSVQYRRTIDMTSTTQALEMPSWFEHLVKDVVVMVTPFQHFGSAWGECDRNIISIHVPYLLNIVI